MTRILGIAFVLIVSLATANAVAPKYTACPSLKSTVSSQGRHWTVDVAPGLSKRFMRAEIESSTSSSIFRCIYSQIWLHLTLPKNKKCYINKPGNLSCSKTNPTSCVVYCK